MSKNVVFFLGAGVSAHLGIPVMSNFIDKVRDSKVFNPDEEQQFDAVLHQCNQLSNSIGGSVRNLENLVSFLIALRLLRPSTKLYESTTPKDAIEMIIKAVAHVASPTSFHGSRLTTMQEAMLSRNCNVTLITTNYDLHIESAAAAVGIKIQPTSKVLTQSIIDCNRRASSTPQLFNVYGTSNVKIFKLHGSVNWSTVQSSDGEYLSIQDGFDIIKDGSGQVIEVIPPKPTSHPSANQNLIMPSVLKNYDKELSEEQWRGAADAIHEADRILFSGYSFPDSDIFMRFAMSASFFSNTRLRSIAVVDQSSHTLNRASHFFTSPFHQEILTRYRRQWHGTKLDRFGDSGEIPGKSHSGKNVDQLHSIVLLDEIEKRGL